MKTRATEVVVQENESIHSRLYTAIVAKIVSGEFSPGQRLVEEDLARACSASRTPVREVLIALHRDGIVQRIPNQGARIARFTADDVEEVYDIRRALECLAVPNAIRTFKLNDLLEFERRLEILNQSTGPKVNAEQIKLDLQLHKLIVAHSGNRRLTAYLENLTLLIHSLRSTAYNSTEAARRSGKEHLSIVRALLRRDVQLAQSLLSDHIETGKREVLEVFFGPHNNNGARPKLNGPPVSYL